MPVLQLSTSAADAEGCPWSGGFVIVTVQSSVAWPPPPPLLLLLLMCAVPAGCSTGGLSSVVSGTMMGHSQMAPSPGLATHSSPSYCQPVDVQYQKQGNRAGSQCIHVEETQQLHVSLSNIRLQADTGLMKDLQD
jgi:hypothetical protein